MVSLIMLSWERLSNTLNNIETYSKYEIVNELFVFNNNHNIVIPNMKIEKVKIIQSSKDLGLFTRYAAAGLAKNDCIMHCDDDLLIPESTVNELYEHWNSKPWACHGTQGRIVNDGYNMKNVHGEVHVVLTRCMLTHRLNCLEALKYANAFRDLTCEPVGNGEDIIISFIATKNSGMPNFAYQILYHDYPDTLSDMDKRIAISKRWSEHVAHRTKVVNRCISLWELYPVM